MVKRLLGDLLQEHLGTQPLLYRLHLPHPEPILEYKTSDEGRYKHLACGDHLYCAVLSSSNEKPLAHQMLDFNSPSTYPLTMLGRSAETGSPVMICKLLILALTFILTSFLVYYISQKGQEREKETGL